MDRKIINLKTREITSYDDVVRDWKRMKQVKTVVALLEQYMDIIPKDCILILLKKAIEK